MCTLLETTISPSNQPVYSKSILIGPRIDDFGEELGTGSTPPKLRRSTYTKKDIRVEEMKCLANSSGYYYIIVIIWNHFSKWFFYYRSTSFLINSCLTRNLKKGFLWNRPSEPLYFKFSYYFENNFYRKSESLHKNHRKYGFYLNL